MYEELKKKYDKGYITKATLKGWVRIERKVKGRGITEEQYEQITGEKYKA
ncbi:MAG: XkdX family protein [Phascolarctobacterium faecium]|nr:XkdX family protein [Phascolarctobacterium faecium]MED9991789.1 XkdX family protein [Phascolarctobacterium faecium]